MSTVAEPKNSIRFVKQSHLKNLVYGVAIVISAVVVAHLFNRFYPLGGVWVTLLEYAGYVFWGANLAPLDIRSWGGETRAEALDQKLSMLLSMLGVFTFTMARALAPHIS